MPDRGVEQLRVLGAALKQQGQNGLRKELLASIRASVKPLSADIKESARRELPKRGGLNNWVASARITSRTRLTGRSVGVQLVGQLGQHDLNDLDLTGEIRHPVFGHRDRWVSQTVTAQFFTHAVNEHGETVGAAIDAAMERVAAKLRAL